MRAKGHSSFRDEAHAAQNLVIMHAAKLPFRIVVTLLALVVCQFGCGRSNSGLPDIFKTDALVRAAGTSQGAVIQGKIDNMTTRPEEEIRYYGDFDIRLSSGTCGQFLTNYQAEVTNILQSKGASIVGYEAPPGGLAAKEGIFRYLYTWPGRKGLVRVIWGTYATNHYAMIVVFAEGRE